MRTLANSEVPDVMMHIVALHQSLHCLQRRNQPSEFVLFDSLGPSQQFFSYIVTGLPGLNQYLARINVSCSRTQRSEASEAQTCNPSPSVSSQTLYH